MGAVTRLGMGRLEKVLGRLRFPHLFLLTGAVFLVDLFVPDVLPMVDEIFLALLTALFGSVRRRRIEVPEAPEDRDRANESP